MRRGGGNNSQSTAGCCTGAVDHNAPMKRAAREKTAFRPGASARWPALAAGLLWLLAGLSAGYWILLAWGRGPLTAVTGAAAPAVLVDVASVARALGARAPAPAEVAAPAPAVSRYSLQGVVDQPGASGAALIALDGQPPRPYRVGASLDGGLVLQSVGRRSVKLGVSADGPTTVELEVPTPSAAPGVNAPTGVGPTAEAARP